MGSLKKETFVCLDCETTGLSVKDDSIIEVAVAIFTFDEILDRYETLIDPGVPIPESSTAIHGITAEMLVGAPKLTEVLPKVLKMIEGHVIVGHGINFDLSILEEGAKRHQIPATIHKNSFIDTLRLARLYGESEVNSLQALREHFNIDPEKAHRAMNDVIVNIEVFKKLSSNFRSTREILQRLEKPIYLKAMPFGQHKGRPFSEIPTDYLRWASKQSFDMDLASTIDREVRARKKSTPFGFATNPFRENL